MLSRPAAATRGELRRATEVGRGTPYDPKNLDTDPTRWRQTAESPHCQAYAYSALSTFRICLRMVLRICGSSSIF
jgi:hypothetical protein